jgi:hypothetical protein
VVDLFPGGGGNPYPTCIKGVVGFKHVCGNHSVPFCGCRCCVGGQLPLDHSRVGDVQRNILVLKTSVPGRRLSVALVQDPPANAARLGGGGIISVGASTLTQSHHPRPPSAHRQNDNYPGRIRYSLQGVAIPQHSRWMGCLPPAD